jgi:hypothetical protein
MISAHVQLRVIRVGSDLSAFGGIADMNSCGKVAMGQSPARRTNELVRNSARVVSFACESGSTENLGKNQGSLGICSATLAIGPFEAESSSG